MNLGGGAVWSMAQIEDVAKAAKAHGLILHMDGARLPNAVVASGVSAAKMCAPCDTTWLDLSKGLGCPVGGVLAGSKEFISEAWRWKHRLGGALRQSGILAAAGLYALDHNWERLAEDHANAHAFAKLADQGHQAGLPKDRQQSRVPRCGRHGQDSFGYFRRGDGKWRSHWCDGPHADAGSNASRCDAGRR
jgi:threonine aldolase